MAAEIHIDASQVYAAFAGMEKQVPFALALGLTKTAKDAQQAVIAEMPRIFDRPTPYTLNSTFVRPATKQTLTAEVGFREFAAKGTPATKYLMPQVEGGGRVDKRFERAMKAAGRIPPGMQAVHGEAAELDAYGNMSRAQIVKILSAVRAFGEVGYLANRSRKAKSKGTRRKEEYFVGSPGKNLPLGVWRRYRFAQGSAVKPVIIFTRPAVYKARFDFYGIVERTVRARLDANLHDGMVRAIQTARR